MHYVSCPRPLPTSTRLRCQHAYRIERSQGISKPVTAREHITMTGPTFYCWKCVSRCRLRPGEGIIVNHKEAREGMRQILTRLYLAVKRIKKGHRTLYFQSRWKSSFCMHGTGSQLCRLRLSSLEVCPMRKQ